MTSKPNHAVSDRLQAAQVAIFNSLAEADLQAALAPYGYDLARLREGEALYNRAVEAVNAAALALAAQKTATTQVRALRAADTVNYQLVAKTARVILSRPDLASLGLDVRGGMPRRWEHFDGAARTVFEGIRRDPERSAQFAAAGYGAEWFDRAMAQHEAWMMANVARAAAVGDRQGATSRQARALRELTVWVAAYIKIARIVLREQPALLEKIGVKVRTVRSAAQVAGRQKAAATLRAKRAAQAQSNREPTEAFGIFEDGI